MRTSLDEFMGTEVYPDPAIPEQTKAKLAVKIAEATAPKPWVESVTIWGGLSAIIAGLAGVFAYFSADNPAPEALSVAIAAVISGIIAVYGRFTATKPIA